LKNKGFKGFSFSCMPEKNRGKDPFGVQFGVKTDVRIDGGELFPL
jgi:hypothetical protein